MDFKYALVIPERLVSQFYRTLMKRRGKNMPQFMTTRFDGDDVDTKLWVEEKEGEWILMSQLEGREYAQEVMTPEEMFSKQDLKPASLKGKILQLFRELGCSTDVAFENTMNFMAAHGLSDNLQSAAQGTKKMLSFFQLLKEEQIQPTSLHITSEGNLMLAMKEEDKNKIEEIHRQFVPPAEEECEDPK